MNLEQRIEVIDGNYHDNTILTSSGVKVTNPTSEVWYGIKGFGAGGNGGGSTPEPTISFATDEEVSTAINNVLTGVFEDE